MIMCVLLCYPVSIRTYYQQGVQFLVSTRNEHVSHTFKSMLYFSYSLDSKNSPMFTKGPFCHIAISNMESVLKMPHRCLTYLAAIN